MVDVTKKEVTQGELEQIVALLKEHEIEALVAKRKPQGLEVSFDVDWLQDNGLAASFPRTNTAGPHFITLSPLLLEWGLTDRIAFSTIILHELAHVIDRVQNWTKYASIDPQDHEALEYEADDFVVACGWKDGLIETLRRSIALGPGHGAPEGMASKRLSRLFNAA
jgi:hypothetical protein